MTERPPKDVLDTPAAGPRVIRGAATRTAGYFAGIGLALLAVPVLTRDLGVADYGRYVVVGSLLVIAMIFADAGLSAVGLREYAVRDALGRSRLMHNLFKARLVSATLAGAGIVAFTVIAGYDPLVVVGTACGAIGLVLTMVQQTYSVSLTGELRFELVAALDLLRQVFLVGGILVLVAVSAGLLAFFVLPIPVALAVLVTSVLVIKPRPTRSTTNGREWRYLLAEALPAATASVLASLFYRVAIVMMSLMATAEQTGYFGIAFRVVEVLIGVPVLIVGSALPVLARAADNDRERLASAFQQLFDVFVVLGAGAAFFLGVGAKPIIALLGGDDFAPAVPVLRIQSLALAVTFLVSLFGAMLWVVRAKRKLILSNVVGVASAILLTAVLVPLADAEGAAIAMLTAESFLVLWLGVALSRHRPELRPSVRTLPKVAAALVVAASIALLPVAPLIAAILGSCAYFIVLLALRAIPVELWRATFNGLRMS